MLLGCSRNFVQYWYVSERKGKEGDRYGGSIKETTQLSTMESRTKRRKLSVSPSLSLGNLHSSIAGFVYSSPDRSNADIETFVAIVTIFTSRYEVSVSPLSWIGE